MGKRKMHTQTYFQCDWTGLPMRQSNCYMPDWNPSGKLLKHGSYVCWEAVIAHAMELTKDNLTQIREHVNDLVGCVVQPAPHWNDLTWFAHERGDTIDSPEAFLKICCNNEDTVTAVRMLSDGLTSQVVCTKEDFNSKFTSILTRPLNLLGPVHEPQSFQTVRKKNKTNASHDLTVFYWPFKNGLPFNQTASNMFKMQIYGDVLLVQPSTESCFLPRERYINYPLETFQEQFANKNKRKEAPPTLTTEDYAIAKAQMASELQLVEQLASSSASEPGVLAKAAVIPPPLGKELVDLLAAKGQHPPKKKVRMLPPVVAVEVAA